jgi:hypothetical protein
VTGAREDTPLELLAFALLIVGMAAIAFFGLALLS